MTHRERVDRLIADLGVRGVNRHTVAPLLFRALWALGLRVPPPLFLGFLALALLMGVPFGALWGVAMWLLVWRSEDMPLAGVAFVSAAAGLLFGLGMAIYYRWKAARLGLPPWESYPT